MIEITANPIDVQKIIAAATHHEAGAVNTFVGTVRNNAGGKAVVKLEYEAYEPMAIAEIQKIVTEACKQWPIKGWAVSHRIGTLGPGEVAVVVAIATPHRAQSFEACQHIIDTLKATVPIWKKEVFEDGEEWIAAHPDPAAKKGQP